MDPARLIAYLRERAAARIRILRLLPAAGPRLLTLAVALQVFAGVVPVAFIVATSAVVGRVPEAVEGGLDSPAWDSLRNALLERGDARRRERCGHDALAHRLVHRPLDCA